MNIDLSAGETALLIGMSILNQNAGHPIGSDVADIASVNAALTKKLMDFLISFPERERLAFPSPQLVVDNT